MATSYCGFRILSRVVSTLALLGGIVCGSPVQAGIVYLKPLQPGETRVLADGTSWQTAYSNVADAVSNADEGDVIKAARGIYVIKSTITFNGRNIDIRGGFDGGGANPARRTIFTGDRDLDDVWEHVEPNLGGFGYTFTETDRRVLSTSNTDLNEPGAFTDTYDGYRAKIVGTNTQKAFGYDNQNNYSHFSISNVTFTGFHSAVGCAVHLSSYGAGAKGHFTDCTFAGNRPINGVITIFGWTGTDFKLTGCTFAYNFCTKDDVNATSCMHSESPFAIRDCTFLSCMISSSTAMANCLGFRSGSSSLRNSTFTRCNYVSASTAQGEQCRGNCISLWKSSGYLEMSGCNFSQCLTAYKFAGPGVGLWAKRQGSLTVGGDCRSNLVTRCRHEVVPSENSVHSLVSSEYNHSMGFLDMSFVSNNIVAVSTSATSGKYLLAPIAYAREGVTVAALNCTFDSNTAEAPTTPGVTPIKCCGIAMQALSAAAGGGVKVGNCTFYGPAASGVYDLAQVGTYCSGGFLVVNSVITSSAERPDAIYTECPEKVSVINTSIKNHIKLADVTYANLETDEVPLVRGPGPLVPGANAAFYPTARAPGLGTCTYAAAYLVPTYGFTAHDAAGNTRTQANALRGAINVYANDAGGKLALTIRREPLLSGTIEPSGGVRAVTSGDAVSVTAVPAQDATFLGWYTTNDEPYGDSPTNPNLSIGALNEDLVLVAKFSVPPVNLTFNLNGGGTFVQGGKSTLTISAQPGAAFPTLPAYVESAENVVTGWNPTFPALVPDNDMTYTATVVSKSLRIIKVVPPGEAGAVQDGKTWATAYGNLATAVEDAGAYRGEVRIKEGTYTLSSPIALKSNVRIRGGYEGAVEDEEPSPATRCSLITGDVSANDTWTGASTAKVWKDGVFNAPVPGPNPWYPTGNASDDTDVGFSTPILATNVVFEGITFTGFGKSAIYASEGKGKGFRIKNCQFLANGTAANTTESAALRCASATMEVTGCTFIGNYHAYFANKSTSKSIVTDCRFECNSSTYGGAAIHPWDGGSLYVTNCLFFAGWGYSNNWRCGPAISSYGSAVTMRIHNCRFYRNQVLNGAMGVFVPFNSDNVVMTRTRFVGNNATFSGNGQPYAGGVIGQQWGSLLARDCEFSHNTNRITGTCNNPVGGILGSNYGANLFVNTTFYRNVNKIETAKPGTTGMFSLLSGNLAFVHCCIDGNEITEGYAEVQIAGTKFAAVNTLFENSDESYTPFVTTESPVMLLSDLFVRKFDSASVVTGSGGFIENVATSGVSVAASPTRWGDFVHRTADPAMYPRGRNVWIKDTLAYVHDPSRNAAKPWVKLLDMSRTATVTGLATSSPLPADALDKPRRLRARPLQGPVAVKLGFMILLH